MTEADANAAKASSARKVNAWSLRVTSCYPPPPWWEISDDHALLLYHSVASAVVEHFRALGWDASSRAPYMLTFVVRTAKVVP